MTLVSQRHSITRVFVSTPRPPRALPARFFSRNSVNPSRYQKDLVNSRPRRPPASTTVRPGRQEGLPPRNRRGKIFRNHKITWGCAMRRRMLVVMFLSTLALAAWSFSVGAQVSDPEVAKGIRDVEDADYDAAIATLDAASR